MIVFSPFVWQVVRSLLMSLAHHETYYSIFNEFVSQNPSVLDEDGFSFMKHCMALLSFDNKQAWLRAKLQKLRSELVCPYTLLIN